MFYGLTIKECRKVAYGMAKVNGIEIPSSWERDKMSGLGWFRLFKKRHPDISVKKPEANVHKIHELRPLYTKARVQMYNKMGAHVSRIARLTPSQRALNENLKARVERLRLR
ncbi:unnamed protein product [Pieris macdunnoughi]|uniref:HTH CENPB-type domain-containing protein n=1 Tax=Pieris macdunnoughi TaxID=345717 RepID=A0A821T3F6_9NEOP|nr:unnamed protein product [Pieris macdunnoughi]